MKLFYINVNAINVRVHHVNCEMEIAVGDEANGPEPPPSCSPPCAAEPI